MASAHFFGGFFLALFIGISSVLGDRKIYSHTPKVFATQHMVNYGEGGGRTAAAGKTFSYYQDNKAEQNSKEESERLAAGSRDQSATGE